MSRLLEIEEEIQTLIEEKKKFKEELNVEKRDKYLNKYFKSKEENKYHYVNLITDDGYMYSETFYLDSEGGWFERHYSVDEWELAIEKTKNDFDVFKCDFLRAI